MEFQFGTNWATYSRFVGDIFGFALAAEAIFAFFLESGFLAVLVFGWERVTSLTHFFSTCMVALGSIFSSIWITIAKCSTAKFSSESLAIDKVTRPLIFELPPFNPTEGQFWGEKSWTTKQ